MSIGRARRSVRPRRVAAAAVRALVVVAVVFSAVAGMTRVVAAAAPRLALRTHAPSDRDLVGARARLALPPASRAAALARDARQTADTLRVVALRVEFQRESPDDDATTGDGTFDLTAGDPSTLDPPPHDADYFGRQLVGLRRYFTAVSGGALTLVTTIEPGAATDAFRLPQPMRYYNPDTTQSALDVRLAEFFRDAVMAADAGGVDFATTDIVMIFHAGVGQDLLLDDPTPSDLPSAFISFGELRDALAPGDPTFAGIAVDDGQRFVRDGFWLPETENQLGIEFSMLGVMVNLMGSQLGLPSLFNTESGAPGIGRFGLMDQGAGNEAGRLPAAPCAWSRFFMGWQTPLVRQNADDLMVGAVLSAVEQPQLYLVPIDSREYYLIENRQQELDQVEGFTLIDSLGTVIGVVADEYDGAIPGSGLLVWHIDEAVIRAGLPDNTVNADFTHRGVDLEEADGVDDIGLRPEGGFGLPEDLFFHPNATRFGPDTQPPTTSNRGHDTHILVNDISARGIVMTFDVSIDVAQPGWPDSSRVAAGDLSLVAADLDGEPGDEILWLTSDGTLMARRGDNSPLFPPSPMPPAARGMPLVAELQAGFDGPEIVVPTSGRVAIFTAGGESIIDSPWQPPEGTGARPAEGTDPIVVDLAPGSDPPRLALAMIAVGGIVSAWNDAGFLPGFPRTSPAGAARSNLAIENAPGGPVLLVAAGDALESIELVAAGSPPEWRSTPLPPGFGSGSLWVLAAPHGETSIRWIVDRNGGHVTAVDASGLEMPGWPRATREPHRGPPALADLRGDGFVDLLLPGRGAVWALTAAGALVEGWPARLDTAAADLAVAAGPLVADVDGDGEIDVLVGSPAGGLFAFDRRARRLDGWPLAAGDANLGTATLADLDADGDVELVTAAHDGWLYGYDLPGPVGGGQPIWSERGGRDRGFRFNARLAEPDGSAPLLEASSVVVYPNPTTGSVRIRYDLGGDRDAELEVGILDVTGRRLRTIAASGRAGTLGEIQWDGRDDDGDPVPSGVYLVRLTARAGGRSAQHLKTIAVTR